MAAFTCPHGPTNPALAFMYLSSHDCSSVDHICDDDVATSSNFTECPARKNDGISHVSAPKSQENWDPGPHRFLASGLPEIPRQNRSPRKDRETLLLITPTDSAWINQSSLVTARPSSRHSGNAAVPPPRGTRGATAAANEGTHARPRHPQNVAVHHTWTNSACSPPLASLRSATGQPSNRQFPLPQVPYRSVVSSTAMH